MWYTCSSTLREPVPICHLETFDLSSSSRNCIAIASAKLPLSTGVDAEVGKCVLVNRNSLNFENFIE